MDLVDDLNMTNLFVLELSIIRPSTIYIVVVNAVSPTAIGQLNRKPFPGGRKIYGQISVADISQAISNKTGSATLRRINLFKRSRGNFLLLSIS